MAGIFQAGVWSCGFDFLPTASIPASICDQVLNATAQTSAARFSGKGVLLVSGNPNNYIGKSFLTNLTQCVVGFAFQTSGLPAGSTILAIAEFYDTSNSTSQFCLGLNSSGQFGLYQGAFGSIGSLLSGASLSSRTIVSGAWYYIEIFPVISSSGTITVNLNGSNLISYTGNTNRSGGGFIGRVYLGGAVNSGTSQTQIDDVYILDTTGGSPFNTFLGPGRIQTDSPSGDVSNNGWSITTPLGTAYQNFAQLPPNSSNYNYLATTTPNTTVLCSFPAIASSSVLFFNVWDSDELDAAGTGSFQIRFSNGGHNQDGTAISPTASSYLFHNTISTVDPNTNALWANEPASSSNSLNIGPRTGFF